MSASESQRQEILSGREAGAALLRRLGEAVAERRGRGLRAPHLVVAQVGDHAPSEPYVRQKKKASEGCGFEFTHKKFSREDSFEEVLAGLKALVARNDVDGIILQLPLDSANIKLQSEVDALLFAIAPEKDADGLHPLNQGYVFSGLSSAKSDVPAHPIPATALGLVRLLQHYRIPIAGREVVVVGRSRLVGAPAAALLMHMDATVTICHRGTKDLAAHVRNADIVIACAGRQHLIGAAMLKPGAVAIDVGIHVQADGKLTGDVDPKAYGVLSAYSPVPGGVGPMTVAGLIENTYHLSCRRTAALD